MVTTGDLAAITGLERLDAREVADDRYQGDQVGGHAVEDELRVEVRVVPARRGRKPPKRAFKRPPRPLKTAIQNRFAMENAMEP